MCRGTLRIAALAGALVAAMVAAAPAPAADEGAAPIASLARDAGAPARQGLEFAIQDDAEFLSHPERLDATLAEVRELGFTHVRLSAHWNQLTRAPGRDGRPRSPPPARAVTSRQVAARSTARSPPPRATASR